MVFTDTISIAKVVQEDNACHLLHTQHVRLDSLNLGLADYELKMEAFEGFRSRQLQASRSLIADLSSTSSSSSQPGLRGNMAALGTDSKGLDDLLLVGINRLCIWPVLLEVKLGQLFCINLLFTN